ncbi:uncharacterized protein F5891DRAFT_204817 [Suillus fuscotomentosus]|uniref:Translation machinery-associated protein 16 n=1 Tax=Suillus fuscotomentosus TaxID=1912939 RepID=A0AAD4EJW2_9AGAM|nr:uncharacterized protein F5891DRAFT_204817 [Suillus fuscotomentosus]KAG1907539.1 hypothetical protein F5891DRAFT_204817 [Suillus fuscotomentosus]
MAPSKTPKSTSRPKKEKVFHPDSRKAGQLSRVQLRKAKLADAASKRTKKHSAQADVYGFFYHAIPPEGTLSLEELHSIISNVWLTRHDDELEQERTARRKGRPKSTKELKLEEIKLRESEQYRTGMDVPDLTHEATVKLFRKWDQTEVAYIQLLRFIRISSVDPTSAVISKQGEHHSLKESVPPQAIDEAMVTDRDDTLLIEPPSRFASTMMMMDGPLP